MDSATQLVVVTGKGGVGKTVVAAALARILAATGRKVLLLDADSREALHRLFGAPPSGGEVVSLGPRLLLQNAVPRAILDREVSHALRIGALAKRVLKSPIYQHFADGAPGFKEMMLLGYALKVTEGEAEPGSDVAVIDAPASGHGLTLLAAPLLMAEVITTGPLGAMAARIGALVKDPARCAIVLPTLAEEMAVQETLETAEAIEGRIGRPPSLVVVNAVLPPGQDDAAASSFWTVRRRVNETAISQLRERWNGELAHVPLVADDFGPALLDRVVDELAPQVKAPVPRRKRRRA